MPGVWSDDGNKLLLDTLVGNVAAPSLKLRLFQNNYVPDTSMAIGSFTEATFAGYAALTLGGWSAAGVAAHIASVTAAAAAFTITAGSQTVYGWFVTDAGGTKVYVAHRDAGGAVAMSSSGLNVYTVTEILGMKDSST